MGRKTYEALGKPLPNRICIILSNSKRYIGENLFGASSLEAAIEIAKENWPDKNIIIGGGAKLYKQVLDMVDIMYITEIDAEFNGDTYFPQFDENKFEKTIDGHFESTVPYTYITYKRK